MGSMTVNLPDDIVALEDALNRWLRDDVVPVFDNVKANPEKVTSLEEAFEGFRQHVRETAAGLRA